MATVLERVDAQLDELFRGYNSLTYVILAVLLFVIVYPLVTARDPDTHPMLLSRQASVAPVRQTGESAVHRALEVPHGHPLKSGLTVRDASSSKYGSGRDGDLRSIWRKAVKGQLDGNEQSAGRIGNIVTIRGNEKIVQHDLSSISKDINAVGKYIKQKGVKNVAIYLPNSVELLTAVFAGAFYGFNVVLLPYGKPKETVLQLLQRSKAEYVVAAAGSLPAKEVREQCKAVKEIVFVVEETSRELDWTDASAGTSMWHDITGDGSDAAPELPEDSASDKLPDIVTIWIDESSTSGELVAFTQQNLVAAVAAQISALPRNHRINHDDLFLPADALTNASVLVLALAALSSNASIALNSVAGPDIPLTTIVANTSPTIIAATSSQAYSLHESTSSRIKSTSHRFALKAQRSALISGLMPHAAPSITSKLTTPVTASLGGKLRLLYALDRTNADSPPTSSARLTDIRAFTGARVVHALTTARVAGTVAQTHYFDYRTESDKAEPGHFGVPPACVELLLRDKGEYKTTEEQTQGELMARGPAVQSGEANLGVFAEFRDDGCLNYLFQHPPASTRPESI